ncbi:hypothetical protein FHT01_000523 [Sphingomonas japonica]|uniref:Uncharacterized protein n=1 Tax=Sphingomonas japonica TaxID=511662 RepID=A0ABX0TXF4_9SPHN|nr:hypothetical protein [Sphingomonas japonica]
MMSPPVRMMELGRTRFNADSATLQDKAASLSSCLAPMPVVWNRRR